MNNKIFFHIVVISFVILFFIGKTEAQLVASGNFYETTTSYTTYPTNHSIYLFSDLSTGSISVSSGSATDTYNWYTYSNGTWNLEQSGSSNSLYNLKETGYKVEEVDGSTVTNTYYCWTFKPEITSATIDTTEHTCSTISFTSSVSTQSKTYYDLSTNSAINLDYDLSYSWSSDPDGDISSETSSEPSIDAPYEETTYTLTVLAFGGGLSKTASLDVEAKAVNADFEISVSDRGNDNEIQTIDLDELNNFVGSAPVNVSLESTAEGTITDYEYNFIKEASDEEDEYTYAPHLQSNTNFTFTEYGYYSIELTVSNYISGCSDTETKGSLQVIEMAVEAPNVFTPNGDGVNDEFKVIYESVKDFKMIILNRWGRKVFTTTNPGDAWNGKIGGSKASEGVYFYYIDAKGYNDGEHITRRGNLHLIR